MVIRQLAGLVFDRLVVLSLAGQDERKHSLWLCRCECGAEKVVKATDLLRSRTRSCGCLRPRSHHLSHTPEYKAVSHARQRCRCPHIGGYENYGGRGIEYRLPDDLAEATATLIAAIGRRPSAGHSLDRIDNDGHYEIGNLRWATRSEQNNNQRVRKDAVSVRGNGRHPGVEPGRLGGR